MMFARERASVELFEEMEPLLRAHWREVARFLDIELDPDYPRYLTLENLGMLRIYTARQTEVSQDADSYSVNDRLIGYCVFLVANNMHYRKSLQAVQDVVFLDKAYRGRGMVFLDWCDRQLAAEGVAVVMHHIKSDHDWSAALERRGYQLVDKIMAKRLGVPLGIETHATVAARNGSA